MRTAPSRGGEHGGEVVAALLLPSQITAAEIADPVATGLRSFSPADVAAIAAGSPGGSSPAFGTIAVAGQPNVVSGAAADTLTLAGAIAVHHVAAALDLLLQGGQVKEASRPLDGIPWFGIAGLSFGAAPGEQSIAVRYASENDGDATKIRDARLLVINAADQFAASDDEWQTASTAWQDKTTLTFTPATAGDYLVIGIAVAG